MKKQTKINICIFLFILGISIFILQLFVFEAPDGFFGFLLCLTSIYLMIGSIIKLCKLSKNIKNSVLDILDLLFFIR